MDLTSLHTRLAVAIARAWLMVLWEMYIDDGSLQDLLCGAEVAQEAVNELFDLLGTGFQPDKRQNAAAESDFLGVISRVG